jgi:hypothetical protein
VSLHRGEEAQPQSSGFPVAATAILPPSTPAELKRKKRSRTEREQRKTEKGLRRETEERREGRKTPPLSPPPSNTADDHNRAFPLQVTFSPPLSFLAVHLHFACRT